MSDPRSCYPGRRPRVPRRLHQTTGNADHQTEHPGMMDLALTPSLDERCSAKRKMNPLKGTIRLFHVASLTLILRIELLAGAGEDREDLGRFQSRVHRLESAIGRQRQKPPYASHRANGLRRRCVAQER